MSNLKVNSNRNYLNGFCKNKQFEAKKSLNKNALADDHPYVRTQIDLSKETKVTRGVFQSLKKCFDFIYSKNPVTQKREFWFVPSFYENFLGFWMYSSYVESQGGISFNSNRQNLVNKVGTNLSKNACRKLGYQFTTLNSRSINAWTLPWGKIAITEGLIKGIEKAKIDGFNDLSKEDKIAAVLSHEIVHADARHTARRLEKIFLINILLVVLRVYLFAQFVIGIKEKTEEKFNKLNAYIEVDFVAREIINLCVKLYFLSTSRSHELEADRYGMYLMKKSGYNPKAAIWLQKFLIARQLESPQWMVKIKEIFSTHPSSKRRLEANLRTLSEIEKKY